MSKRESIERLPPPPSQFNYTSESALDLSSRTARPWTSQNNSKQNQASTYSYHQQQYQQQQHLQQQQLLNSTRSNGLLGRMFRKGPPKNPKLNPIGISSKEYFSSDSPPSAPIPTSPADNYVSPKSVKLTRKLSALSSSLSQSASPPSASASVSAATTDTAQSLTPMSATTPGFLLPSVTASSYDGILEPNSNMTAASTHPLRISPFTPPASAENQRIYLHRQSLSEHHSASAFNVTQNQPRHPTKLNLDSLCTGMDMPVNTSHTSSNSEAFSPRSTKAAISSGMHPSEAPQLSLACVTHSVEAQVPHSALLSGFETTDKSQVPDERKRRGSLWRAKLGFTNIRRPESRRQRHQSYDSNAVDIAAHPRMYAESPLVSVPSAAPTIPRGQDYGFRSSQPSLEALLGVPDDASHLRSTVSAASIGHSDSSGAPESAQADIESEVMSSVSNLGTIDREFLLTIQRNSALEARRQRRRETRRNTMSFLGSADKIALSNTHSSSDAALTDGAVPETLSQRMMHLDSLPALPLSAAATSSSSASHDPPGLLLQDMDKNGEGHARDKGLPIQQICRPKTADIRTVCQNTSAVGNSVCRNSSRRNSHTISTSANNIRSAGRLSFSVTPGKVALKAFGSSSLESSNEQSVPSPESPKKLRPASSDSLTYTEALVTDSSRPSSSEGDKRWRASGTFHQKALSEMGGIASLDSTSQTVLTTSKSSTPSLSLGNSSVVKTKVTQPATRNPKSPSKKAYYDSGIHTAHTSDIADDDITMTVPPVPPLPLNVLSRNLKPSSMQATKSSNATLDSTVVADCESPRYTLSTRKYRKPISTTPPFLQNYNHGSPNGHTNTRPFDSMATEYTSGANTDSLAASIKQCSPPQPLHESHQSKNSWDDDDVQAAILYQYRIVPASSGDAIIADNNNNTATSIFSSESRRLRKSQAARADQLPFYPQSLSNATFARKFSHPDAQLQSLSNLPQSPVNSPDIMSKSASNLTLRMSIDSNKAGSSNSNSGHNVGYSHRHGIGRLFSVSPSSRKVLQPKHLFGQNIHLPTGNNGLPTASSHQPLQRDTDQIHPPTSPTVSSLVDDPLARRRIRDQLASSKAFDRLLEEDDEFTMAISLTPTVAGISQTSTPFK
ncbi:hypothetical protein GGI25_002648 [Coemansia spiralis]|uniref:Uncharacterized protein n=2 Tax=Coemansia TaxID=4863 RepID=A0A9W8GAA6_9FUNG|nr:hypothetical protein BX070DRAFT_225743 [Coemansia spiralis]KAJ1989834.1 hypothetical protein EDC05_004454 [Coemansia umbellata]KAJ2620624.1 hypothetical protein GGI26_004856 [Coemansia sp. RSA 1358]KAJ2678144.1 hypothetical protein GGI25_002648 [Coemansia spiralis]